ncbi:hypothetical protein HDK90DRAFT_195877 [Phyllosticta capitalensis]|uniref:Uncharacterized protein n=2 Tax=Phyllosticta capitalensis TaxID=121624 RepID=A0ABR1YXF4_9PEZI
MLNFWNPSNSTDPNASTQQQDPPPPATPAELPTLQPDHVVAGEQSTTAMEPPPPPNTRLAMSYEARMMTIGPISAMTGFFLGLSQGVMTHGLRFRAENAHRLPSDPAGWFLYHKRKNYVALWGGIREGLFTGFKTGFWACGFLMCEQAVDRLRGLGGQDYKGQARGDFGSTVIAGLGTAGAWSLWNRLPITAAARTAKTGLLFGLVYGLVQDATGLLRGQKLAYVESLRRIATRASGESEAPQAVSGKPQT